jgi:hypothetical protein
MTEFEPTTVSCRWEGLIRRRSRRSALTTAWGAPSLFSSTIQPLAMEVAGNRIQPGIVSCPEPASRACSASRWVTSVIRGAVNALAARM